MESELELLRELETSLREELQRWHKERNWADVRTILFVLNRDRREREEEDLVQGEHYLYWQP